MNFSIFKTYFLDFLFSTENIELNEKLAIKKEILSGCFVDTNLINWISNDLWENFRKNENFENALKMITFDFQENTETLKRFWKRTVINLICKKEINYQIEPYLVNLVTSTWEIIKIFSECYFLKKDEHNVDLQDIFDDLSDSLEVQNNKNVIPYISEEKKIFFCNLLLTYKDGRGTVPWKELKEEKEDDDELLKDYDVIQENYSIMSNTIALAFNTTINPYLFSFFTFEYVFNYPVINLIKESLKYISNKLPKPSYFKESENKIENEVNLKNDIDEDKGKINYIEQTKNFYRINEALKKNKKSSEKNKESSEKNKKSSEKNKKSFEKNKKSSEKDKKSSEKIIFKTDFNCSKEFSIENLRDFNEKTKNCKLWKNKGLFLQRKYFAQEFEGSD